MKLPFKMKTYNLSAEKGALVAIFLSASFLFGILASLVANGFTDSFDTAALLWINQHASPAFDTFFTLVTKLGDVLFVVVISLVLALYLLTKKQYSNTALVVFGLGGAALIGAILKAVFERSRPDLWEWLITETSYSFPSGHATASMALAYIVVILLWRTRLRIHALIAGVIYVGMISASRLYLGVHYPSDILGGWLLSLGWVSLVALGCIYVDILNKRPSLKR